MLRLSFALLLLGSLALPALAQSISNKIVLLPGDVVYARFEPEGKKIRLAHAGKEVDERAQVIFNLMREAETLAIKLKVENKFPQDFIYQVVVRSKRLNRETPMDVVAVVGGKRAFEEFSPLVDEVILSGFKLVR